MKVLLLMSVFVLSVFHADLAFAKKKKTYSDPCDNAFDELPKVDDNPIFFPEFETYFKKNAKCIDGGIVEEIHARVVLSLEKNWKQLDQLIAIGQKNPKFQQFILSNYIITTNNYVKEAESTLRKAKRCPKKQAEFCKELQEVVKKTLADEKKLRK